LYDSLSILKFSQKSKTAPVLSIPIIIARLGPIPPTSHLAVFAEEPLQAPLVVSPLCPDWLPPKALIIPPSHTPFREGSCFVSAPFFFLRICICPSLPFSQKGGPNPLGNPSTWICDGEAPVGAKMTCVVYISLFPPQSLPSLGSAFSLPFLRSGFGHPRPVQPGFKTLCMGRIKRGQRGSCLFLFLSQCLRGFSELPSLSPPRFRAVPKKRCNSPLKEHIRRCSQSSVLRES